MTEMNSASGCDHANELVAFLYSEVNEAEVRAFELHLQDCSDCKADFVELRLARQSVGAWRDECLGVNSSSVVDRNVVEVSDAVTLVPEKNRSAIGAVKQFFAFSPLWMKGAVAFASLVFCVAAAVALSHLLESSQPAMVANEKLYTEKELEAKIEERMQSLAKIGSPKDVTVPATNANRNSREQVGIRKPVRRFSEIVPGHRDARRSPLTKTEREQLAADLRLTSTEDDEALDLLDDNLNN